MAEKTEDPKDWEERMERIMEESIIPEKEEKDDEEIFFTGRIELYLLQKLNERGSLRLQEIKRAYSSEANAKGFINKLLFYKKARFSQRPDELIRV